MIIEINYVGNEANEEPQKLDDIKIMAIDTQTKQLIDNLKEEVADLDSRLDAVEEGGGDAIELPAVTADDDGSVLGVVDGQWDKMEQGESPWDAVISIYHDAISSHDYELNIISGSYSGLKAKLMNNQPPLVLAYVWDELSSYRGATTMTSIYYSPSEEYPNRDITFTVKMPSTNTSNHTAWFAAALNWTSADVLGLLY